MKYLKVGFSCLLLASSIACQATTSLPPSNANGHSNHNGLPIDVQIAKLKQDIQIQLQIIQNQIQYLAQLEAKLWLLQQQASTTSKPVHFIPLEPGPVILPSS